MEQEAVEVATALAQHTQAKADLVWGANPWFGWSPGSRMVERLGLICSLMLRKAFVGNNFAGLGGLSLTAQRSRTRRGVPRSRHRGAACRVFGQA
jgi:hypothetical protein